MPAETLPSRPSNLTSNWVISSNYRVSWNGDALYYNVCAGPINTDVYGLSYTLSGLEPYTTYTTKITPYNTINISGLSQSIDITTLVLTTPETPSNVRIFNTSTTFTVSWEPAFGALSYYVYVNGISYEVLQ